MHDRDSHECPDEGRCPITVERVGDLVIVDIPADGRHVEIVLGSDIAIRLGTALITKGADETEDSLSDDIVATALDRFEEDQ